MLTWTELDSTQSFREAARRKIKPILLENDPEKILEQSHIGTSETKPRTKLVGKPRTIALSRI